MGIALGVPARSETRTVSNCSQEGSSVSPNHPCGHWEQKSPRPQVEMFTLDGRRSTGHSFPPNERPWRQLVRSPAGPVTSPCSKSEPYCRVKLATPTGLVEYPFTTAIVCTFADCAMLKGPR